MSHSAHNEFVDRVLPATAQRTGRLAQSLQREGGQALVGHLWREAQPPGSSGSPRIVSSTRLEGSRVVAVELPAPHTEHLPRYVAVVETGEQTRILASTPLPGGRAMLTQPAAATPDRVIDGSSLESFLAAIRVDLADEGRIAAPVARLLVAAASATGVLGLLLWLAPQIWMLPLFNLATLVCGVALFVWIYFVHVELRGKTKFSPVAAVLVGFIPLVGVVLVPYVVFDAIRAARGGGVANVAVVVSWWMMLLLSLALGQAPSGLYPAAGALLLGTIAQGLLCIVVLRLSFATTLRR